MYTIHCMYHFIYTLGSYSLYFRVCQMAKFKLVSILIEGTFEI